VLWALQGQLFGARDSFYDFYHIRKFNRCQTTQSAPISTAIIVSLQAAGFRDDETGFALGR
jgi:hypothetical protein